MLNYFNYQIVFQQESLDAFCRDEDDDYSILECENRMSDIPKAKAFWDFFCFFFFLINSHGFFWWMVVVDDGVL